MEVSINKVRLVGSWSWDLGDNDNCTICMTPFECPCPTCKIPGDDCPPVEGNCGHFFHLHCIYKWLATNDKCPLDREVWTEKIGSLVNNNNLNNNQNNNNGNDNASNENDINMG